MRYSRTLFTGLGYPRPFLGVLGHYFTHLDVRLNDLTVGF